LKTTIKSLVFIFTLVFLFNPTGIKAQMFWNQAASFAGNNTSYVSVPNSTSINLTGSFTLEAWVNPTTFAVFSRGVIAKGGFLGTTLRYGIRILSAGRITINTAGSPRCTTKTAIQLNVWSHISVTYNSTSNEFKMYLNGILDTSAVVVGATPPSNTDSLFIGISGSSTPYNGQLDEVRIWNREISSSEVNSNFRTSLCVSDGIYEGLILSMPFQKESSEGIRFTARDLSGNNNNGNPRNVISVDQSFRPLQTISQNNSVELDGDEDYLAAKDTSTLNPSVVITLECWVYPRTANQSCQLISKGNQYAIILENGVFKCKINGSTASSGVNVPANEWTKLTFEYAFIPQFYVDGIYRSAPEPIMGSLTSGTDSLYIGGSPGVAGDLNGFIDEVRIFDHEFSEDEIYYMAFSSMDKSNSPSDAGIKICYNLDGATFDNSENGGPKLHFRNNASFSDPGSDVYKPVSPLNRNSVNSYPEGFYHDDLNTRLPLSGTSGTSNYILRVNMSEVINDVDVMISLNHRNLSSLNITVIAPNNDSVRIATGLSTITADNSLTTVFDDQADSSYAAGKYVSFHTSIKPQNNMNSVFAGDNTLGTWRIRINDVVSGDTGVLNAFGIKFNNMNVIESNFSLSNFVQGFYNPATDFTISDTITMFLRKSYSPFEIIDSCKRVMDQFGTSYMSFKNTIPDTPYTLSVKHRNSIEIWSNLDRRFKYKRGNMNFQLSAIVSTFGGNEIQVDASPVRFAMYGGDVNQDGVVDATDLGLIDNDAFNFVTGYVNTDLTGDDVTDASDAAIADNNAFNFVKLSVKV